MKSETIETTGHTDSEGMLKLAINLHVGVANTDVAVIVSIAPNRSVGEVDDKGYPVGYFERFYGSMPDIQRGAQGDFEKRLSFE